MATTTNEARVSLQPAYVLHQRPYSDTSAQVEIFSRDFGRVALIAKGARQMRSPLRSILTPFQALHISWTGKGEVKTLTQAETDGPAVTLSGDRLLSGLYVNELMLKLLPRFDAHDVLFERYAQLLAYLEHDDSIERPLRRFEKSLLVEMGYELVLETEADRVTPIDPTANYRYVFDHGPVRASIADSEISIVGGVSLLALSRDELDDTAVLHDAKKLLRAAINHYLGDKPLHTRELIRAMHRVAAESEKSN